MKSAEDGVSDSTTWQLPQAFDEPTPFYEWLRTHAPVWRVPGTTTSLVSRWADVVDATARVDDFSSNLTALIYTNADGSLGEFDTGGLGANTQVLAVADPPSHGPQRKLVVPHLTAQRLAALEHTVDATAAELMQAGLDAGRIEWMGAVGDRLPMTLVAQIIGLPTEDVPQLIEWAYLGTELLAGVHGLDEMGRLSAAAAAHGSYLGAQLERAVAQPQDDLIGDLARAVQRDDLSTEQAVGSLVVLVGAGGESTAGLIGNAARILAEQPMLQAQLRADLLLVPRFLEEVLRLESPFRGHYRTVRRDTVLAGTALHAGEHLLLLWAAANRDPAEFSTPDDVDLERRISTGHISFGRGIHFCVGAPLARLEARAAVSALLRGTSSFTLDPDDPPARVPSIFVRRHARLPLVVQP